MKRFTHSRAGAPALALLIALFATAAAAQQPPAASDSPLVADADRLVAELQVARERGRDLEGQVAASSGEERVVLERQLLDLQLEGVATLHALQENVLEQEDEGLDASAYRELLEPSMARVAPRILAHVDAIVSDIRQARAGAAELSVEDLAKLEAEVADENAALDERYALYLDHLERMQALGMDVASTRAELVERLGKRAEVLEGILDIALEESAAAEERVAEHPDDKEASATQLGAERKVEWATTSLAATADQLEILEVDVARYRQYLIETTGEVTSDIFDRKVALGLFERWVESARESVVENGPALFFKLVIFALILLVFRVAANFAARIVRRAVMTSKLRFSVLLQDMFVSVASKAVMVVGILVALSQLGFQLGPILAGLGVAGFIVGFALQDTLSNFAAGAMILVYRPYDVGDMIEAAGGVFGKVSHMSLVSTTILTIDNQTLVVPNSKIWGDVIKNVTAQRERRIDMVFGISYSDDIPKAERILESILEEHPGVLKDPEPVVRLHNLGESSVDFVVRPWVRTEEYWDVYWHVTREVKMRFDREGVSIPFPQRDVHFYRENGAAAEA
jgi:small conductance mechanosensitive channel